MASSDPSEYEKPELFTAGEEVVLSVALLTGKKLLIEGED
jgi:hypothetical protein